LRKAVVARLPLGAWLDDLNRRIRTIGGGDARNRQIGHSFLLERGAPITSADQLVAVLRDDIVPLLEEYCYDDFTQLATLLGRSLVDEQTQRVKREWFEVNRIDELVTALMRPEISTAPSAVLAAPNETETGLDDDDESANSSGGG
jgi:5-methylcytosine-specific restriction protein B